MSNPRYISGIALERQVKKDYEKAGYFVVRAAGSRGAADLVCLHPCGGVLLIQCKVVQDVSRVQALSKTFLYQTNPLPSFEQGLFVKVKGERHYRTFFRSHVCE